MDCKSYKILLLICLVLIFNNQISFSSEQVRKSEFLTTLRELGIVLLGQDSSFRNTIAINMDKPTYFLYIKQNFFMSDRWSEIFDDFFNLKVNSSDTNHIFAVDCNYSFPACEYLTEPVIHEYKNGELTSSNFVQSKSESVSEGDETMKVDLRDTVEANSRKIGLISRSLSAKIRSDTCGGFVDLSVEEEIIYNKRGTEANETCIWILWASKGGPIILSLVKDDEFTSHNSSQSTLSLHTAMSTNISVSKIIEVEDASTEISFHVIDSLGILVWSSRSTGDSQGFHVKLKDSGSSEVPERIKWNVRADYLSYISTLQRFYTYPEVPSSLYLNNERFFVVLRSSLNKKLTITVNSVETESTHDYLSLFEFSKKDNRLIHRFKYTGSMNPLGYDYQGVQNQPFLVYFHTDVSVVNRGFKFSYNYI